MEVAGPLGTPLGLAQRKRASPRGEAGMPPLSAMDRTLCTEAVTCALFGSTRLLVAARCTVPFPSSSDSIGGKVAEYSETQKNTVDT